jgi:phage terminase large subunit-like protein
MALSPEAKRKRNQRARDAGLPEPFPHDTPKPEEVARRKDEHDANLAWAQAQDTAPTYYRSEYRSCVELLGIYEGSVDLDKSHKEESDDDLTDRQKRLMARDNRLNPSQNKITIRAVVHPLTGEKIEPDQEQFKKTYEVNEIVSFQRWLDLRDKARKDLLWLCRLLEKMPFHSVHQYVCDQFVQKNFDGMFFPGFNLDDFHAAIGKQVRFATDNKTPCKGLVLLEPRGSYKTTINGIDAIQWMINCPDIRIMFITAFKKLVKAAAKEIKRHFYLETRGTPTPFQLLFPEFVLLGVKGRSASDLECPAARFNQKESNLWITSMESSSTGLHCDVRKADDVVDPKNSADEDMRAELKFKFDGTSDILDQWSFWDTIGTRYFTDDWYGTRMLPTEDYVREEGDTTGGVDPYRFSCRGSWTLTPEIAHAYQKGLIKVQDILNQKLGTLIFPFKLSWPYLRSQYRLKGERSFKNQQLNEATDKFEDSPFINEFTEDLLKAHFRPSEFRQTCIEVYKTIQVWDTAYGENRTSDFSVGVTALIYKKDGIYKVLILDVIYDKWRSSELSFHILEFFRKWHPESVDIEKSNGSDHLFENLRLLAGKHGVPDIITKIRLVPIDLSPNAKRNRIKHIQSLMSADRWDFINGAYMDEMMKQMTKFTGEKSTASRKDDIPDALSFVIKHLPFSEIKSDDDPKEVAEAEEKLRRATDMKNLHDMMFSLGGTSNVGRASDYQARPKPSVTEAPPPLDPRRALLNKYFGGNGMRA